MNIFHIPLNASVVAYSEYSINAALSTYTNELFLDKRIVMSPLLAVLKNGSTHLAQLGAVSCVLDSQSDISLLTVERQEGTLDYESVTSVLSGGGTQTDTWTVPVGERWVLNSWQSSVSGAGSAVTSRALSIDSNRIQVSPPTYTIDAQLIKNISVKTNQTISITTVCTAPGGVQVLNGIGFYRVRL